MAILKIAKFSCAFQLSVHVVACVIIFCSAAIMASPLVGSIGEFDTSTETFTVYHERLEQYFVANSIGHYPSDASTADKTAANKKKVAVMISVIGKKTYGTLRDLCSPENPKDKTFEQLCELLERHFKPKRLEVAESYRFHRCIQEENETVSVYSARLRLASVAWRSSQSRRARNRAREQSDGGAERTPAARRLLNGRNLFT